VLSDFCFELWSTLKLNSKTFLIYYHLLTPERALVHVVYCLVLVPLVFSFLALIALWRALSPSMYAQNSNTALMEASANGRTATVQVLLGAGADKEAKGRVRERITHTRG
jgi:hypothetical protein